MNSKNVTIYRIKKAATRYFNVSDKPYNEASTAQKKYMDEGGEYRSPYWKRLETIKNNAVNTGMEYQALLEDLGLYDSVKAELTKLRSSKNKNI